MPGLRRGVKGLRLARMPEAERGGVEGEVLAAYDRSVAVLADLGADIVELRLPRGLRELGALNGQIMSAEAYALVGDIVDDAELLVDEAVRPRIRAGAATSARDYLRALSERERLKAEFAAAMEGVDAVLTPTAVTAAVRLGEVDQAITPALLTRWVNLLDLCGLAVPNGFTAGACRPRCRSCAGAGTRPPRSGSAGPTRTRPIGTTACRRWSARSDGAAAPTRRPS
jgi:aspartyl-tRNA(Asn)/glutamyl-tRNA(Gln) amidotransferase subunit A